MASIAKWENEQKIHIQCLSSKGYNFGVPQPIVKIQTVLDFLDNAFSNDV